MSVRWNSCRSTRALSSTRAWCGRSRPSSKNEAMTHSRPATFRPSTTRPSRSCAAASHVSRHCATRMLVSGAVLGLIAGLAIARSWRPLLGINLRWLPLLLVALIARAVAPLAGTSATAFANVRLPGVVLVAVGGALNLLPVLANGGMPVDAGALAVAGATMPNDLLHLPMTSATLFSPLADVIPVSPLRSVYSVGDVCIAIGGFLLPFVLLIRR